jgi:hypothetical protein
MVLGGLILLLLVIFVKSAFLLLPWTITAAVIAGLSGIGLGILAGRSRASGSAVSVVSSFALTIGYGYLGYWLVPPTAPPQKQGLDFLLQGPEPKQEDLWQLLPIHLAIVAIIVALIVSRLWHVWLLDQNLSPDGIAGEPDAATDNSRN